MDIAEKQHKSALLNDGDSTGQSHTSYGAFLDSEEEPSKFAQKTIFGEVRSIKRLGWPERVFIVLATASILTVLGFSIQGFVSYDRSFQNLTPADVNNSGDLSINYTQCTHWTCINDFIYTVAVLVNLGFCAFYCYDGLLRERPFEMIGYAVGVLIIVILVVIDFVLEESTGGTVLLARLILACVVGPQNIVLALVVQWRMGYLVLNTVGSNTKLTRAYHVRSLYLTMQRFNVQTLASVLVFSWSKNGAYMTLSEKILLPILLVYVIFVAYFGWVAVMWEMHVIAVLWYFFSMPCLGYYIFKIIKVGVHWDTYKEIYREFFVNGHPSDVTHFTYIGTTLIIVSCLGVVCYAAMSVLMFACQSNFGKGLKEKTKTHWLCCCSKVVG